MKRQRGHSDTCLLVEADGQGQGPGACGRRELWEVLPERRKTGVTKSQLGKTPREELENSSEESKFSLVWGMKAGLVLIKSASHARHSSERITFDPTPVFTRPDLPRACQALSVFVLELSL